MRMEIRPGEGGVDAEQFVIELSQAVSKHSNKPVSMVGSTAVLDSL